MKHSIRILIVDDEAHVCTSLEGWFLEEGYAVSTAGSGLEALEAAVAEQPQILLVDVKMPGMDGLTFQRRVLELLPNATVIIMTAFGSVDTAVLALKEGAYDYILKPFDPENLSLLVSRAAERYATVGDERLLQERLEAATPQLLVTEGGAMAEVLEQIERVASTRASVLLRGESGTGKRLLARRIHASSPQRFGPFVSVDCGSASATSLGCDLFGGPGSEENGGRERGRGSLELAENGTLYLGAIDRMTLPIQTELLRVLEALPEEGGHRQAGTRAGFRLVVATEGDLEAEVAAGRFRRDLFLRIAVFCVEVPPLRERPEDLPLLATHFLERFAGESESKVESISPEALVKLGRHPWSGNVRELQHVIEAAVIVGEGPELRPEELVFPEPILSRDLRLSTAEGRHLRRVLLICGHDPVRTAAELAIGVPELIEKMGLHGIGQQ